MSDEPLHLTDATAMLHARKQALLEGLASDPSANITEEGHIALIASGLDLAPDELLDVARQAGLAYALRMVQTETTVASAIAGAWVDGALSAALFLRELASRDG